MLYKHEGSPHANCWQFPIIYIPQGKPQPIIWQFYKYNTHTHYRYIDFSSRKKQAHSVKRKKKKRGYVCICVCVCVCVCVCLRGREKDRKGEVGKWRRQGRRKGGYYGSMEKAWHWMLRILFFNLDFDINLL